jgi:hypothetical protein
VNRSAAVIALVPSAERTVTSTVEPSTAGGGAIAMIAVLDTILNAAGRLPKSTSTALLKFFPVIRTGVSTGPWFGVSCWTTGTFAAAGLTVSVAALLVAVPPPLVNTARNLLPDCEVLVGEMVSVVVVAPETFVNVEPPSVDCCHCTVGAEQPAGVEPAAVNVAAFGAVTVTSIGCVVTVGATHAGFTVSVAALLVAEPALLVNTARYLLPDCDVLVGEIVSVVDVAPVTFVNVVPPSVDCCHCTVGAEQPAGVEPAAVNVASAGAVTVTLVGCVVTLGATQTGAAALTVSVALLLVAVPPLLVNTARYLLPDCEVLVGEIVNVVEVAPETFVNVVPPSVDCCHCTVGAEQLAGVEAAALNVAGFGAVTVTSIGCVVTVGATHAGLTVSVAALLVALPAEFVNTARYLFPDCDVLVGEMVSVVDVAPVTFVNVVPPSVDCCHCTVGAEQPAGVEPAAVNVAAAGAVTVTSVG